MSTNDVIAAKVDEFIKEEVMFTSVSITRALQNDGVDIRNSPVRDWLRKAYRAGDSVFSDYDQTTIEVCGGKHQAFLYHPCWKDPDDFKDRNIQLKRSVTTQKPSRAPTQSVAPPASGSKNALARVITSTERIKIPGAIIRKLGWQPGDKIDPDFIDVHEELPTNLYVNKDYRVSIPRNCVNWSGSPVKVDYKNGKVVFEKA